MADDTKLKPGWLRRDMDRAVKRLAEWRGPPMTTDVSDTTGDAFGLADYVMLDTELRVAIATGNDAAFKAALSNNFNIILAALKLAEEHCYDAAPVNRAAPAIDTMWGTITEEGTMADPEGYQLVPKEATNALVLALKQIIWKNTWGDAALKQHWRDLMLTAQAGAPKSPATNAVMPSEAELRAAIFNEIDDCSTTDYHDMSPEGVDNLAMLATRAVMRLQRVLAAKNTK